MWLEDCGAQNSEPGSSSGESCSVDNWHNWTTGVSSEMSGNCCIYVTVLDFVWMQPNSSPFQNIIYSPSLKAKTFSLIWSCHILVFLNDDIIIFYYLQCYTVTSYSECPEMINHTHCRVILSPCSRGKLMYMLEGAERGSYDLIDQYFVARALRTQLIRLIVSANRCLMQFVAAVWREDKIVSKEMPL